MENERFYCDECDAEFEIVHDSVSNPEYCPFCSTKLDKGEEIISDDEWE